MFQHTLQHFATFCNLLQHCSTYAATCCNILQPVATYVATVCNILQHVATYVPTCTPLDINNFTTFPGSPPGPLDPGDANLQWHVGCPPLLGTTMCTGASMGNIGGRPTLRDASPRLRILACMLQHVANCWNGYYSIRFGQGLESFRRRAIEYKSRRVR